MNFLEIIGILLVVSGLVCQFVQMKIIVPFVVRYRGKRFFDSIPGSHQYKRLEEYREICKKNGIGLFWYNFQIVMTIVLLLILIVGFLSMFFIDLNLEK